MADLPQLFVLGVAECNTEGFGRNRQSRRAFRAASPSAALPNPMQRVTPMEVPGLLLHLSKKVGKPTVVVV